MKKHAYKSNSCDICGGTVHELDQMILALVGLNHFIHMAFYLCPACLDAAEAVLVRKAKKLKTEPTEVSAIIGYSASPRAAMTRDLQRLLSADFRAHLRSGLRFTPVARSLRARLNSRLRDFQVIPIGYYAPAGQGGLTSEATFTALGLDTSPNLVILKSILCNANFCDCAVDDAVLLSEYSRFYGPGHGDEVIISRQLVGLINCFSAGVIDIVMKLQAKGLSAFKSVEQCVHIFETLNFSLPMAEDYVETCPAVRKQLKL